MSEVLEICGLAVQTTQVIGIGALQIKITPGDFEAIHRLSFDLILRNHSIRVEIGTFILDKTYTIPVEEQNKQKENYHSARVSYDQAKCEVLTILKLRAAHEI